MDLSVLFGAAFVVELKLMKENAAGVRTAFPVQDYDYRLVQLVSGKYTVIPDSTIVALPNTAHPGWGAIEVTVGGKTDFSMQVNSADVRVEATLKTDSKNVLVIYLLSEVAADGSLKVGKVFRV